MNGRPGAASSLPIDRFGGRCETFPQSDGPESIGSAGRIGHRRTPFGGNAMLRPILATAAFATLALSLAATPPASAAQSQSELPQVLGLVATKMPVPLDCRDGTCAGYFSAFCMQEKRPIPKEGQIYDAAGEGDITLVVEKRDGSRTEFSAAGLLRFESQGSYTSIKIAMDEARLASLDAAAISVRVPRRVSLLPRAEPNVAAKPSPEDLETATGEKRLVAEGFFEGGSPKADATALMARLINMLPPDGYAPVAVRRGAWDKAMAPVDLTTLAPEGVARARDAFEQCNALRDQGYRFRVRGCLEKSHDDLMKHLNDDYWKLDGGY